MSNLLIAEPPLVVLPSLARAIGLNEALVLQQIHFWIGQSVNEYDGHKWMYRTDKQWLAEFSFWSESTLRRAVASLKKSGLIRVERLARHFGGNSFDQKKYYTVIYSAVDALSLKPSNRASSQNDQMEEDVSLEASDCAYGQNDQMEVVKTNNPSSQNDQFRSSQNDQFRSSQNDQMFTENKKEYYREEGEPAPTAPESSLFALDLKPASALSTRNAFPMHFEWEPSGSFFERCKVQGIRFDLFSSDEQEQILGEFRSYWEGKGTEENQGSWEHKLCSQVKRKLIEKASSSPAPTKQDKRASVTAGVMNVADTSW
ncbi:DnaT-like ssDNA-binding domain-containing protein [Neptuniibacter pectenicola]|uniref:DnaT-like ssDNA-binding domain-containing protein n=1 Tax=Neptuniibacter pectenicola TaxID=1806669 RepID=UPI000837A14F|nr:DnaT-like ssDNA-binding domain-containing protein [Neptuniibacter pectenicola]